MDLEEKLRVIQTRLWTEQLYREYDNVLFHYKLKLSRPSIQISEHKSYWGRWDPILRTISINRRLIQEHPWDITVEVLKHEMAHQIVHEYLGQSESIHGPWFSKACDMISVANWARRATGKIEQHPGRQASSSNPKELAVMERIEKLLALHQSDNEHEAYLAMREAKRLSDKHNLSMAASAEKSDHDYIIISHGLKITPQYQTLIGSILTSYFMVDCIFSQQYDPKKRESFKSIEIMGTAENIKMAEYVYYFLWNQLPLLWKAHQSHGRSKSSNRKSFYIGILSGFNEQLDQDQRATQRKDHVKSSQQPGLINIAKKDLSQFVRNRHPRIQSRSYQCSLRDKESFQEGKKQGRLMKLRRGLAKNSDPLLLNP